MPEKSSEPLTNSKAGNIEKSDVSNRDMYLYFMTFLILITTMMVFINDHHRHLQPQEPHQSIIINYFVQKTESQVEKEPKNPVTVKTKTCDDFKSKAYEIFDNFFVDFPSIESFQMKEYSLIDRYLEYTSQILMRVQNVSDHLAGILNLSSDEVAEFIWDGAKADKFPLSCFTDDLKEILEVATEAISLPKDDKEKYFYKVDNKDKKFEDYDMKVDQFVNELKEDKIDDKEDQVFNIILKGFVDDEKTFKNDKFYDDKKFDLKTEDQFNENQTFDEEFEELQQQYDEDLKAFDDNFNKTEKEILNNKKLTEDKEKNLIFNEKNQIFDDEKLSEETFDKNHKKDSKVPKKNLIGDDKFDDLKPEEEFDETFEEEFEELRKLFDEEFQNQLEKEKKTEKEGEELKNLDDKKLSNNTDDPEWDIFDDYPAIKDEKSVLLD